MTTMPRLLLTPRAIQIMAGAAAASSLIMVIMLAVMWSQVAALGRTIEAFSAGFNEANERLKNAGEPTVAPPPTTEAPPGVVPEPRGIVDTLCQDSGRWRIVYTDGTANDDAGPCAIQGPGPSAAAIAFAVHAYCRDNDGCRGPSAKPGPTGKPGTDGKDGLNVTPAQVAAAVATYCDVNGQCAGKDGERGPGPTDDQIIAAVTVFCADGACRGEDGKQGEPGRGIAKNGTNCIDGRWQITYTDGETEDAGACTSEPAPTETITEPGPTTTVTITPTPTPTG